MSHWDLAQLSSLLHCFTLHSHKLATIQDCLAEEEKEEEEEEDEDEAYWLLIKTKEYFRCGLM